MKYYVFTATGRTGSKRICSLLYNNNKETIDQISCDYTITSEKEFVSTSNLNVPLGDAVERLDNLNDGLVIHSHACVVPTNKENWTFIHAKRKIIAEQIMSHAIADKLDSYNPVEKNIVCPKFNLIEKQVKQTKKYIETLNFEFESKTSPIKIYVEDSLEEIERKLNINFSNVYYDTKYKSNHHYKDIIINYKEVFEWCGEEYIE